MKPIRLKGWLLVAALVMAVHMYAQHGHSGGMGHGPMGPGSSMDHGPMDRSHAGDTHGFNSATGKKSPDQLLAHNTKLASKLQSLLPPGTNLQQAAAGFKNLGQFVAAVHVSHNLGISFNQLKAKMTGPKGESLGKAIHQLKPDANAKAESKKADKQADRDMNESGAES